MQTVTIHTEYIKLESLLKLCGAAGTGGAAKTAIQNGQIAVNGAVCLQRGKKLRAGDTVTWSGIDGGWTVAVDEN